MTAAHSTVRDCRSNASTGIGLPKKYPCPSSHPILTSKSARGAVLYPFSHVRETELRLDQKLNFRDWTGYQLYVFGDAGAVWNDGHRLSDGLALTSAGAGVRFFPSDDLQADLAVAVPLSYRAPDNERRSPRFLLTPSSALRLCPEGGKAGCL